MKLNKIFEDKFFVENVEKAEVRFYEEAWMCNPPIHTTSINLLKLYKDWWDECNYCPENGTFIYAVEFNVNGKIYWMDKESDFEFQTLMEEFREHFPEYDPYKTSSVLVKVTGYVAVDVTHDKNTSTNDILKNANEIVKNINFGELDDIKWKAENIIKGDD